MSGKKLIFKAKFAHKKHVIPLLSQRLALLVCKNQQIKPKLENNQLFISYIPSHWRRQYYGKWYNQSKLFSKKYYIVSQLHVNREERKKNLKWVFHIEDLSRLPKRSTVLLVDDVTTTGSTLSELVKTTHNERNDLIFRWAVIARNMW